jgi:hypothetical protein
LLQTSCPRSYGEHAATTIILTQQAGYEGGCHDCNIQPIPYPILRAEKASSIEEESGDEFDEKPRKLPRRVPICPNDKGTKQFNNLSN